MYQDETNNNNLIRVTSAEAVPDHGDLLQRVLQFPVLRHVVVDDVVDLLLGGAEILGIFPIQLLEAAVTLQNLPCARRGRERDVAKQQAK